MRSKKNKRDDHPPKNGHATKWRNPFGVNFSRIGLIIQTLDQA